MFKVQGLKWHIFTWGCWIKVIFRICNFQIKTFCNDVSYVGLSKIFIISTCLRFKVWDGIVSPEGVGSWWHSESVISKSRPFQWCIKCGFILKFYNLYMFKSLLIVLKTLSSVKSIFLDFSNQGNFPNSLNMWRLRNQRTFELQKYIIPWESSWKALSKFDIFKNINWNVIIEKTLKTLKLTQKYAMSIKIF